MKPFDGPSVFRVTAVSSLPQPVSVSSYVLVLFTAWLSHSSSAQLLTHVFSYITGLHILCQHGSPFPPPAFLQYWQGNGSVHFCLEGFISWRLLSPKYPRILSFVSCCGRVILSHELLPILWVSLVPSTGPTSVSSTKMSSAGFMYRSSSSLSASPPF